MINSMPDWVASVFEWGWLKGAGFAIVSFMAGAFLKPLGTELWKSFFEERKQKKSRNREKDKQTLDQIMKMLRPDDEVYFFRHHDHGNSFHNDTLTNIVKFVDLHSVEKEFIDIDLEKARQKLHSLVEEYTHKCSLWTWTLANNRHVRKISDSLYETRPDEWEERRQKLNHLGDEIVIAYETLVKTARKKL